MFMTLLPYLNVCWLNIHKFQQIDNSDHPYTHYIPITFHYGHILISIIKPYMYVHIIG